MAFPGIETLTGNNGIDSFLMDTNGSIVNLDGSTNTGIVNGTQFVGFNDNMHSRRASKKPVNA